MTCERDDEPAVQARAAVRKPNTREARETAKAWPPERWMMESDNFIIVQSSSEFRLS